jgi:hypothetical protein
MAAAVKASEHHSVEAISFTPVTRFSGDERRGDNLAVKTVLGEDALEDETSAGRLVAGPNRSFLSQASKETADFHEITGELYDLGIESVAIENGGRNRIGVHVETN